MQITEILFWNNEPAEANDYEPQLDQAPARSSDDVTNLATAFTRRGLVKHFWKLERIRTSAHRTSAARC